MRTVVKGPLLLPFRELARCRGDFDPGWFHILYDTVRDQLGGKVVVIVGRGDCGLVEREVYKRFLVHLVASAN